MSRGDSRDATPAALVAAEVGLLCVGLGTALGFSRLFIGWGYLGPLALAVAVSWALAVLTRRLRLGVGWSGLVSVVSAVFVITWVFAPRTTFFGLPTAATVDALVGDMRGAFGDFSDLVAPVPVTDGFLVVLAAILWAFTFFGDTAAFRYRGPVQAVIPYTSAFIAAGVLARDTGRVGSALAFLAGMGLYAVTQRALVTSERRWMRGEAVRGTWAVASGAAVFVVLALGIGVVAGPWLPGDTEAVVDLRSVGREGGARTVVSPFVGVRNLLGQQTDQVVFTVRSDVPSYWRLTALSRYDTARDIWVSRGSYQEVDGSELATPRPDARSTASAQEYEVQGLGGPWFPTAFEPVSIDVDAEVSFDPETSSVITRSESLTAGTRYRVSSALAQLDPTDLSGARIPDGVPSEYLDDAGVSPEVARAARQATSGAPSPYDRMLALQTWFRDGFVYDTDVDYRDDADPVAAFLEERRGFCQQFASTFSLMARSLGLPSRVAVGFTQGDAVGEEDGATEYVVRGRHAHTWPEVYFDGIGWVAFEPTTGRGNPQAQSYTGVEPQQAEAPAEQATTTTAPAPTTTAPSATPTTLPDGQLDTVAPEAGDDAAAGGGRGWLPVVAVVVALVAVAAIATVVLRRRRRGLVLRDDPIGGRVALAWMRTTEDLAALGVATGASETPTELAERFAASDVAEQLAAGAGSADADGAAPDDSRAFDDGRASDGGAPEDSPASDDQTAPPADAVVDAVRRLAQLETERRYGRRPSDEERAVEAEECATVLHRAARSVLSTRQKVRQLVR